MTLKFNNIELDSTADVQYKGISLDVLKLNGTTIWEKRKQLAKYFVQTTGNTTSTQSNRYTYITDDFVTMNQITAPSDVSLNGAADTVKFVNNKFIFSSVNNTTSFMYISDDLQNYNTFGDRYYKNIVYSSVLKKYVLMSNSNYGETFISNDLSTFTATNLPHDAATSYANYEYTRELHYVNNRLFATTYRYLRSSQETYYCIWTTDDAETWYRVIDVPYNVRENGTVIGSLNSLYDLCYTDNGIWHALGLFSPSNWSGSYKVFDASFTDFSGSYTTAYMPYPSTGSFGPSFLYGVRCLGNNLFAADQSGRLLYTFTNVANGPTSTGYSCYSVNTSTLGTIQGRMSLDNNRFWFISNSNLNNSSGAELYFVDKVDSNNYTITQQSYDRSSQFIYNLLFIGR